MTMLGYQNKVLRINLTEKKASTEPLRMDFAEKYIGDGSAKGAKGAKGTKV